MKKKYSSIQILSKSLKLPEVT